MRKFWQCFTQNNAAITGEAVCLCTRIESEKLSNRPTIYNVSPDRKNAETKVDKILLLFFSIFFLTGTTHPMTARIRPVKSSPVMFDTKRISTSGGTRMPTESSALDGACVFFIFLSLPVTFKSPHKKVLPYHESYGTRLVEKDCTTYPNCK